MEPAFNLLRSITLVVALAPLAACGGGSSDSGGGSGSPAPVPPTNRAPVAVISAPTAAMTGTAVSIDARASSDPDGDALTYRWTLTAPGGSGASIGAPTAAQTAFTPDVPGSYQLQLVVNDGRVDSAPATHTMTATAPSPIRATLQTPPAGGLVGDTVRIVVTITSTFEVSSVIATLAGQTVPLVFAPDAWCSRFGCGPGFAGTVSLAGRPTGRYALSVEATDVRGNVDRLSVEVIYDSSPVLAVISPLDQSVALPTVELDARCTDDVAPCVVELRVNDQLQRSAASVLREQLDLSAWMGRPVRLDLTAVDSAGQRTRQALTVYVESPDRLTVVTELPGPIVDADGRRLLFVEPGSGGDRLSIHDRSTGLTEAIPVPSGRTLLPGSAFLTPSGAIFVTQATGGSALSGRLYLWASGVLTDLGFPDSLGSLAVAGEYAIWNQGRNLHRLNTTSGGSTLVSDDSGNTDNAVAADGTVVFWNRSYQIVQDKSGQQSVLISDPEHWHVWPRTDGKAVLYHRRTPCCTTHPYAIVLYQAGTSTVLAAPRQQLVVADLDYQIRDGWVAFTDLGNLGQLHVFTRSPAGAVLRHTDFGSSSRIDRLGGNGEVMVLNGERRLFSRGDGTIGISSSSGRSYWLDNRWYVSIGRAFLSADTGH